MKKIITIVTFTLCLLALPACEWFSGGEDKDEVSIPNPAPNRGEFKPGPVSYVGADGHEHLCNAPGGWCSSDNSCHSSAAKCPIVRE